MNKKLITREYEYHVYNYLYLKRGYSCAMEVRVPLLGRADIVGIKKKEIIVVEIKTSKQDLRSKHGHNFIGTKNYYAVPPELVDYTRELAPQHIGIMTLYKNKDLRIVKNARTIDHKYPKRFYEQLTKSLETAKQSNIRRLLYHRYKLKQ